MLRCWTSRVSYIRRKKKMCVSLSESASSAQLWRAVKERRGRDRPIRSSSLERLEQDRHAQSEVVLQRLRAVANETKKWEEREARWVRRLHELEERLREDHDGSADSNGSARSSQGPSPTAATRAPSGAGLGYVNRTHGSPCYEHGVSFSGLHCGNGGGGAAYPLPDTASHAPAVVTAASVDSPALSAGAAVFVPSGPDPISSDPVQRNHRGGFPGQQDTGRGSSGASATLAAAPLDALSVALLAQQLPSIPNYNRDNLDGDRESFGDWLERLELVASACRWDDQAKLVKLATCLRGTASRFYCLCTPKQRSSYQELVAVALHQSISSLCIAAFSMSASSKPMRLWIAMPKTSISFSTERTLVRRVVGRQKPWGGLSSLTSFWQGWWTS